MRSSILLILTLVAGATGERAWTAEIKTTGPSATLVASTNAALAEFNLPASFAQIIADRAVIDAYQGEHHQVEAGVKPVPNTSFTIRNREGRFVRIVSSRPPEDVLKYRAALPAQFAPLRGFRAPILERAGERTPAMPADGLSKAQQSAAECVAQRLARDGLLPTLAQVIEILGPAAFTVDARAGLEALMLIGFPTDLLACFPMSDSTGSTNASLNVIQQISRKLSAGATAKSLQAELAAVPFRFALASRGFRVATESGEDELGMLRVQAGGGYSGGIVPGASIDVINQLVNALPKTDFLISVPQPLLEPYRQVNVQSWRLRHTEQVTLVGEPLAVAAWAQDNGKAGLVTNEPAGPAKLAVLTPRYACMDEGQSRCEIGESFLMDGLRAAGLVVAHSSLLFQGGNLMVVRDPKTGQRLLLIGEGELYRNVALGLTREQVLEAFRLEFGVDRCLALPAVSYHLDFDICIRARDNGLVAFVNDPMAAARIILGLGINALERAGALDTNAAANARADLAAGRDLKLLQELTKTAQRQVTGRRDFPSSLSKSFVADRVDSAAGNLQTFLLAIDLLESSLAGDADAGAPPTPARADYLRALRRMEGARRTQMEVFQKLGWSVVTVPSMGELYRGINYLNGIHHRDGYIMPVFGGFYAPLDQAALAVFREALGAGLKITFIQSAECQRDHGGVHCTAAAYPKL